jgi:hypothetical protein
MRNSLIFAFVISFTIPFSANAGLVYDGFNYPVGTSLSGENGGSGWGAPWDSSRSALGVNVTQGLAFKNLISSPGSVTSDPALPGSVAFYTRQLSATYGADNTTLYMSVLLRPNAGFGFYGGINLDGIFIGKSGTTNTYGIEDANNNISSTSVTPVVGTTVFLVLRANFQPGNDRFSLYVDPTPGGPEPVVPDAVKTNYDLPPANNIFINNAGGWTTDEIRLGSTFASVAPAPEPAALALFAGGALILAARYVCNRTRFSPAKL